MSLYQPNPSKYPEMWSFLPDETDNEFYIVREASITEIMELANEKWQGEWKDLVIRSEYIHTDCIYYDLYNPSDYTEYLCINRII